MPFPLLEFISFGLSSLNSEVYFPMRDLFAPCGADGSYISPGPLQRPGDFFLPVPAKTSLRVRPCVRSARCRRTFSSPILPIPDPPGPFHPKRPERPTVFRDRPPSSPPAPSTASRRAKQTRSRLPRARHLPARQLFPAIIQQRRHEPVYKRVSFLGVRAPVLETAKPQPSQ